MLHDLVRIVRSATASRYLGASVVALGCDWLSLPLFLLAGVAPGPAAALGYSVGIVVHWLLSSRMVFTGQVASSGAERTRQKVLFVGSALVGLLLTWGIVGLLASLGMHPLLGKGFAVGVSFVTTWLLRSRLVFAA